ncbi:MAG: hypothetical protein HFH01_13765 [Dorea sp.]|nr:hypothetical protein [Dorea sp.]
MVLLLLLPIKGKTNAAANEYANGRKHKSKLDGWKNQWSGSLAAPLIFAIP